MTGKRILICCNRTLTLGGIEKSLVTFLGSFQRKENEIWLVLADSNGILTKDLPINDVHVFYTDSINTLQMLLDDLYHFRIIEVLKGVWNRIMLRLDLNWYANIMYLYRIKKRKLVFPGHFDCAIAFSTDYSDLSMVEAANTTKRIAFVHGDATKNLYAAKMNDHLLCKMDKIYSVSKGALDLFLQVHSSCAEKMDIFHNIIDVEEIMTKAQRQVDDMTWDGWSTLCTVGRLSPEKGVQLIPETAELLLKSGKQFRWYIVGEGSLRLELEKEIRRRNLEKYIVLLGGKSNPYPYIKHCDIYVQPSLSEAYCITVAEARVLCKPIVSTPFSAIAEQIENGINGLISSEMTSASLAESIMYLFDNPQLQESFINYLKEIDSRFEDDLSKLYAYIC